MTQFSGNSLQKSQQIGKQTNLIARVFEFFLQLLQRLPWMDKILRVFTRNGHLVDLEDDTEHTVMDVSVKTIKYS